MSKKDKEKKMLIIPIISPIRKKSDNQIKYNYATYDGGKPKVKGKLRADDDGRYNSRDYYVCARSLNNLKLSLKGAKYNYVAPALTTGEGAKMKLEIWKSLINLSVDIFEGSKVIPGIMFANLGECVAAISYVLSLGTVKRIFLTPIHEVGFKEFFDKICEAFESALKSRAIKLWIYLPYFKEYNGELIENNTVMEVVHKYPKYIEAIKDSRTNTSVKYINELIDLIADSGLPIKVLQGWERQYLSTNDRVAGGVFPLAVIEPEIIQSFINKEDYVAEGEKEPDEILETLIKKYCKSYDWIWRIKKEFISRPFDIQYDERDFSMAFDKFFEVYSEEKIDNFHVQRFDIKNPLTSILRTLFSDLVSLQTSYFRYHKLSNIHNSRSRNRSAKETKELLFIPLAIRIVNLTDGSYAQLLVQYKPKQRGGKNGTTSKSYARLSGNWIEDFKDMNNEFFRNNYDIEKKILIDSVLKHLHYGDNVEGNDLVDQLIDGDNPLPEFTPEELKFGAKLRSAIKLAPSYTYISEDQKDQFEVNIAYVINPKDVHSVPDSLFTNLTRVAIFTKRNRIATDEIERHSIKSAIAAVMSRNISHNIGSHVLVKLSDQKNVIIPWDVSRLNQYLKHRMSFIADLSTAQATATHTNDLKSEIIENFTKTKLLINYISGNDNIGLANIEIAVYNNLSDTNEPLLIDLPNDIIGRHAIYTILENYIRNCAKYSVIPMLPGASETLLSNLKISIFISEPPGALADIYYQMDIIDNLGEANIAVRSKIERVATLPNGGTGSESFALLNMLQDSIDKPILQNGKVRVGGWGILEMKICAAFLRKYELENIDDTMTEGEIDQPSLLKASFYETSMDNQGKPIFEIIQPEQYSHAKVKPALQLGYRLYVLKPKTILIIFQDKEAYFDAAVVQHFGKAGIDISYIDDRDEEDWMRGTSHKLLIFAGSKLQKRSQAFLANQRKLWMDDAKTNRAWQVLLDKNTKNAELFFWTEYVAIEKLYAEINIIREAYRNEKSDVREAYFDDHGKNYNFLSKHNKLGIYYYEPFTSQTGTNTFLSRYEGNYDDPLLKIRLAEVASVQIAVIDERIQRSLKEVVDFKQAVDNSSDEEAIAKLSLEEILTGMGIFVPNKSEGQYAIDLDKQNFNKQDDTDHKLLTQWITYTCEKHERLRFVIIHLNIIEKMKGSEPDIIKEVHTEWKKILDQHNISLVFVSGRGEPSTIPEGSLFMPYDCLEEYLVRFRSKNSLIDLLYGLRKKVKKGK